MQTVFLAAFTSATLVVLMYVAAACVFRSKPAGIAAAMIFVTAPLFWHQLQDQRTSLLPIAVVLVWLIATARFADRRSSLWAAVAGGALGAGVYTSNAAVVMMPIYLVSTLASFASGRNGSWHRLSLVVATFAIVALPFAVWTLLHPENVRAVILAHRLYDANRFSLLQGMREMSSWVGLTARSDVYYGYFHPTFLFFTHRVLFVPLVVLLPVGLYQMSTRASGPLALQIAAGFFLAPFAGALTAEPPTPGRMLFFLPFAALVSTYALQPLMESARLCERKE